MTQQTLIQSERQDRLTSEQQSVENFFNLICLLKINHDRLQATYKMTLLYQNNTSPVKC